MSERVAKSLAAAMIERRGELRLSQQEVAARAGLSVKQVQRLEGGVVKRPQSGTLHLLDGALDWPAGHTRRLRDGEIYEPAPAPERERDRVDELIVAAIELAGPEAFLARAVRLLREYDAAALRERPDAAG